MKSGSDKLQHIHMQNVLFIRYFRPGVFIINFQSEMRSASFQMTFITFCNSLQRLVYKSDKGLFGGVRMTVLNVRVLMRHSDDQHIFLGFASEHVLIVQVSR